MSGDIYDKLGISHNYGVSGTSGENSTVVEQMDGFPDRYASKSEAISETLSDSRSNNKESSNEEKLGNSESKTDETTVAGYKLSEVQQLAKTSLDFLAALALPHVFKYLFPPVYLTIWQWLLTYVHKTRDFSQLALGLPRGFAKSSLIKLFCLYVILFTERKFIAIMGENQSKGEAIVSDIMDMLEELNIVRTFGNWRAGEEKDTLAVKKFGFRGRNIIIVATTVQTIRGINIKNARPDVMIFDDIQNRTMAESQEVSEALERELYGTAMKSKSPEGCLFVFIANMYPTKWSILRKLQSNPNWIKFISGGILSDGTSLWEDLQPIAQLHKEFLNDLASGHPEIFYAEVLNDPDASVNTALDLSKIPPYPFQDNDIHSGGFIVIDPSNDKKNSDAVAIVYFEIHRGAPVAREIKEEKLSPGDIIREAIKLCLKWNCYLVAIESNAFQYSLLYWSEFLCQQMGIIGISWVDVYSGVNSKNSRILAMFKKLLPGQNTGETDIVTGIRAPELYIHPDCKPQVDLQIIQFNPRKTDNTDNTLDCLTYAHKVMDQYGPQILMGSVVDMQDVNGSTVEEHNHAF